jgi:hypothetical protein
MRMGSCDSDKWVYVGDLDKRGSTELPDGVHYSDCGGYTASFQTGEDFGCVHHSSNEDTVLPEGAEGRL